MARGFLRGEEHSPHTLLGSIYSANHGRVVGHNLCEASGMIGNVVGERFEVH